MVVGSLDHELVEAMLKIAQSCAVAFELGAKVAESGGESVVVAGGTAPQLLDRVDDVHIEASVLLALGADAAKLVGGSIAAGQVADLVGSLALALSLLVITPPAVSAAALIGFGEFLPSRHDPV